MFFLCSCRDECREYSDFSCKEIEEAEYNVYFYYPSDNSYETSEKYLGQVKGLNYCGSVAFSYAKNENLSRNNSWGYICCMIANGSACYEKHR